MREDLTGCKIAKERISGSDSRARSGVWVSFQSQSKDLLTPIRQLVVKWILVDCFSDQIDFNQFEMFSWLVWLNNCLKMKKKFSQTHFGARLIPSN